MPEVMESLSIESSTVDTEVTAVEVCLQVGKIFNTLFASEVAGALIGSFVGGLIGALFGPVGALIGVGVGIAVGSSLGFCVGYKISSSPGFFTCPSLTSNRARHISELGPIISAMPF